jgi:hypothetical protein
LLLDGIHRYGDPIVTEVCFSVQERLSLAVSQLDQSIQIFLRNSLVTSAGGFYYRQIFFSWIPMEDICCASAYPGKYVYFEYIVFSGVTNHGTNDRVCKVFRQCVQKSSPETQEVFSRGRMFSLAFLYTI